MAEDTGSAQETEQKQIKTGQVVKGKVTRLELYGAFVDIGAGQSALLHISQLGKADVRNVEDEFKIGDEIEAYVLKVHDGTGRVALTLEKPPSLPWHEIKNNSMYTGEVVRIEDFGVFVDIGAERPGMVHVSELASGFVKSPSDVVSIGEQVEVRVLKVNRRKRQIDLTMKVDEAPVVSAPEEEDVEVPTAMALALQRAMEEADDDVTDDDKKKSVKNRGEQDDILSRTLREHLSS